MGWSSGSRLASGLIEVARETISSDVEREAFYEQMIDLFEDFDCDTLDECAGYDTVFDCLWKKRYDLDEEYEYDLSEE